MTIAATDIYNMPLRIGKALRMSVRMERRRYTIPEVARMLNVIEATA